MGGLGGFFPPLLLTAVSNITGHHAIAFMLLSEFALVSFVIVIFMYYRDRMNVERNIIEGTAEGIMVTNKSGIIQNVNPAFTRITGYTLEEAKGNTPRLRLYAKHGKDFYDELWKSVKENGYWEGKIWKKRKNGERYQELRSISPIKNNVGDTVYYVGIFNDIS